MREKPIVKLLTLWVRDQEPLSSKIDKHLICHGIWETISVSEQNNENVKRRVYELVCVSPRSTKLKVGARVKMYEDAILALCTRVELVKKYEEKHEYNKWYEEQMGQKFFKNLPE